jgi:putative exporter of polyketide antibiotics
VSLGSLLLAGVNIAPPSLLVLGLGALTFGVRPRWTPVVVYGYLAWSFLVELLGSIVHASHRTSAGVVTGIAVACAGAFSRRNLTGS